MSTRVLVAEDSLTVRKHLVDVLSAASDIEVVGEAADGKAAIELCQRLRPDVMTLDMMLPILTGLAATEYVMAYCPTPILIVSASTNRGELFKTYDALAAGALDVLEKPSVVGRSEQWDRELVTAVRRAARIKVITHPRARLGVRAVAEAPVPAGHAGTPRRVVAIGASTGGPAAVLHVLSVLPADFPLPILLVMHIAESFGAALAEWLDGQSRLRVRQACDGDGLPGVGTGVVVMAPPGRHLEVAGQRLRLTDGPPRHSCRPSVDVLFESVAGAVGGGAIGCLLTGMGRDGAAGLLAIRQRGGVTIAQNEATSLVFGMPAEAIRLDAATDVLALDEVGPFLARLSQVRHVSGEQW